jgi:photosystem II stability/assembly factor-like uncharacterized protein
MLNIQSDWFGLDSQYREEGALKSERRLGTMVLLLCRIAFGGWVSLNSGTLTDLDGLWFQPDARVGYATGGGGLVLKTTDSGSSWDSIPSGFWSQIDAVCFPADADTGYCVTSGGRIYKTTNGAASWTLEPSGVTLDLRGICFPNGNQTGYVVGGDDSVAVILKTTNGGGSWARETTDAKHPITGVSFGRDAVTGYAVGWSGVILKTSDGGAHWMSQTSPTTGDLVSIQFPADTQTGYAIGSGGTILKTTGSRWCMSRTTSSSAPTARSSPNITAYVSVSWRWSRKVPRLEWRLIAARPSRLPAATLRDRHFLFGESRS